MRYKLKEIFELQMGKTPSRNKLEYWNTEEHKWISIADLTKTGKYISETKEYLSDSAVEDSGIKVIPANTVVMSFKLSIGKTAITAEDMYSNEAIMAFHDKHVVDILPEYIYYMFKYKNWDEGSNKAVMGKTLNKAILSEIEIDICSMEEQRKIVEVLDKMMAVLEGRETELSMLDDLIRARFVEMFGDPANNEKGFIKAPMGDYMTLLTDFSSNGSYKTLDSGVTMYDEPNYAWMVRTTDLESGDMTTIKYIDESAYELLSNSKIYGGEIIMNKIGSAGKIYLMPQINIPASLGRNAFMFRYDERINVKFLYHLLTSEYGQREIQQYVRGAVTKTITKNDARAVLIIVPPIELQNEFEAFVAQVDKSKAVVQKSLEETQLLFDSLMQKYFG
ncbi:restriction endonuclease subunit S [uncultured Clostridium sp.]|uniref:restriction endonuclease subunit S n=1 Tax=uncultured Clostridium sp. TaxID=59620 RepID=UPI0025DFB8A5|nr:restriction endonuclease subunit S [uncultured Clostridium sp.]